MTLLLDNFSTPMKKIGEFDFSLSLIANANPETLTNLEDSFVWYKVLLFLFILGFVAYLLNYLSKKKNVSIARNGASKLAVIDTCSLGNRQFLVVAQYESDKHLLAVSSSGISHLAKIDVNKKTDSSLINGSGENIKI